MDAEADVISASRRAPSVCAPMKADPRPADDARQCGESGAAAHCMVQRRASIRSNPTRPRWLLHARSPPSRAFIVCDEPVSALDVSVQATIVNLLPICATRSACPNLFISHDLAVVAQLSDRVAVMYHGRICEIGTAPDVLAPPYHPYTRILLASAADDEPAAEPAAGGTAAAAHAGCVLRHAARTNWARSAIRRRRRSGR